MRLLIYGMQSSGASTLAYLLAQKPDSSAFIDVWAMYAAPTLPASEPADSLVKVVVTTAFSLALHQERFQPDKTILFLRHPDTNYRSLATKDYQHHCGFIEEKFALIDDVFAAKSGIDSVIYYEDLLFDPAGTLAQIGALGWECTSDFLKLKRRPVEIVAFNKRQLPSVVSRLQYGMGNYRPGGIKQEFANLDTAREDSPVAAWCPKLVTHYAAIKSRWQPPSTEPVNLKP